MINMKVVLNESTKYYISRFFITNHCSLVMPESDQDKSRSGHKTAHYFGSGKEIAGILRHS